MIISDAETMLTESGRLEHIQLGERFKKRLPDLMGGSYQKDAFVFRHTYKVIRTPHVRHRCTKTTVLSCQRCLIYTGVEEMNYI
jgi:hypothetical protein